MFFLPVFQEMLFAYKAQRHYNVFRVENFMRMVFFLVFLIVTLRHYTTYNTEVDHPTAGKEVKYFVRIYLVEDAENEISYYYAIGSFVMWVNMLYKFRLTRFFGPLFKMIEQMLQDISVFMLLYLMQLILFACVGHILFSEIAAYEGIYTGSKTLFDASLGNYSFLTLEGNSKSDLLGDLFTIGFIVINHILLINLLIAILSSTYALYEQHGVSLYVNGILQMRPAAEYNSRYGALVSTFPPWNVFLLPFIPFYLLKKDTKKLNRFAFHLTYLPILLISFMLFAAAHIIIIPFAYFKCLGSRFF